MLLKEIKNNIKQFQHRWLHLPFLIIVGFFVTLLCFGDYNYSRRNGYVKQISDIKVQIQANEDSAAVYEAKIRELNTDRHTLERIAREKYGMKRANEDVYVTDIP
ncbi:MAG: septum formation initiator family protein [Bacteroidales bacterium]|nr:septum formation initiator family protein [Bacteroidales bacterium]MDY3912762.1 septum formation initiator family protein [Sodaliphilus sp.]